MTSSNKQIIHLKAKDINQLLSTNSPKAKHYVTEAEVEKLSSIKENLLKNTLNYCKELNLSVLDHHLNIFPNGGVTLVLILKESHLAIHSWPEYNYIHMDLVTTCSSDIPEEELITAIQNNFPIEKIKLVILGY